MTSYKILLLLCLVISVAANELFMTTPQILENRNVSYEKHTVLTEDGYILAIFRIPRKERRGVVVLQHSLSLDSSVFLVSQKRSIVDADYEEINMFLAMEIYDAGYELWLPNFRGLPFSDGHVNPNLQKLEYWNFSFHEIGYYDIPAILNHVTNVTKTKVIVINHSLSSTASLVYSALRPKDAQDKVKVFVNLASSAFMNHTRSPFKNLIGLQFGIMKPTMELLNMGAVHYDFFPYLQMAKQTIMSLVPNDVFQFVLETSLEFLFGKSGMGIDPEEFPMIVSVGTQPYATKIMYHYSQLIQSGRFCMYDYGSEENLKRYNSSEPTDYPLEAIVVPTYLVISDTDTMSDAWGSHLLYDKLPNVAKIYGKLEIQNVNHADYLVGKNRFIYFQKIIEFINSVD